MMTQQGVLPDDSGSQQNDTYSNPMGHENSSSTTRRACAKGHCNVVGVRTQNDRDSEAKLRCVAVQPVNKNTLVTTRSFLYDSPATCVPNDPVASMVQGVKPGWYSTDPHDTCLDLVMFTRIVHAADHEGVLHNL